MHYPLVEIHGLRYTCSLSMSHLSHRWKSHDRNHVVQLNSESAQAADQARMELAELPRWQRLIPLVGQAAVLRHTIDTAERQIENRRRYHRA